ncbi:MAG: pyridoxal-phosphate dependent enzyme, partial [Chloroflexota bacterium]
GNPASWHGALAARDESGGRIDCVSDDEIIAAYKLLAGTEGVFGEPASAASVAGLLKLSREGMNLKGKRVVCVITGSGLKDPDTATGAAEPPPVDGVAADLDSVERFLGWVEGQLPVGGAKHT